MRSNFWAGDALHVGSILVLPAFLAQVWRHQTCLVAVHTGRETERTVTSSNCVAHLHLVGNERLPYAFHS